MSQQVPNIPLPATPEMHARTAYHALSAEDKDAVDTVILWSMADRALQATARFEKGDTSDRTGMAYRITADALLAHSATTNPATEASMITERDIETNRILIAESPAELRAAREVYRGVLEEARNQHTPLNLGDTTRLTDRMIAIDGDQVSDAQVQAELPARRREGQVLRAPNF